MEAARFYLYQRLGRPPFPPDVEELAHVIDRFYARLLR